MFEKKRDQGNLIQIGILYLTVLLGVAAGGTAMPRDGVLSTQVNGAVQRSDGTMEETIGLRRLASGLSSGSEAMLALRGSQSENNHNKDTLEPPIVDMECNIDRIGNYVSCYSSPVNSAEEAETLFAKLLYELQTALPSDSWIGIQKQPGIASSRSHSYQDQRSNAHIDIDIVAPPTAHGSASYVVSIFGWPGYKLAGYDELDWKP